MQVRILRLCSERDQPSRQALSIGWGHQKSSEARAGFYRVAHLVLKDQHSQKAEMWPRCWQTLGLAF